MSKVKGLNGKRAFSFPSDSAAHTLKGVAGNLGLKPLFDACSETVFLLREQNYEKALKSFETLRHAYIKIIGIIRFIERGEHDAT